MTHMVSRCCKKDLYAVHTSEGDSHYHCRHCEKPCCPILINQYTFIEHEEKESDNGNVQPGSGNCSKE